MATDPAWQAGWLEDLHDVPRGSTWPRLMTAPHPAAVGSYGDEVATWIAARSSWPIAWHQQLILRRAFEHDAAGDLCWREVAISMPRQFFKSTTGGAVCAWRLEQGDRFGEPQFVLHVAKDLGIAQDIQRPWRNRAKEDPDVYKVLGAAGRVEVNYLPDDSRYVLRSVEGSYGQSVSMVFVDEAFGVSSEAIDVVILPTLMQRKNPQIWMASTANTKSTGLMLGRRAAALAQLEDPGRLLWIEWSAPPGSDPSDRASWRAACPYFDEAIEQDLSNAFDSAVASRRKDPTAPDPVDGFAVQRLNMWRDHVEPTRLRGDPFVDGDRWADLHGEVHDDPERIWIAVEDHAGFGAAIAAVCVQPDGRYGVDGWIVDTWPQALADLRLLAGKHDTVRLQAGASLMVRLEPGMRATAITSTVTRFTLPAMRELVTAAQVVHDSTELDEQVASARVVEAIGGLNIVPGARSDLLRAASWALAAAARPRKTPSIH